MSRHRLYLEHFGDGDVELVNGVAGVEGGRPGLRSALADGLDLDTLLGSEQMFTQLFSPGPLQTGASPFLVFSVLVNRVLVELGAATYVAEWTAPRQRLPVFDVAPLREFLADDWRRHFVIELLASFTKIASGSMLVRTAKGYRRRRFSELDPVGLAELVEGLPPAQRPGGYRRLGDVALFLCGVFPDHTASNPLRLGEREMLTVSAGLPAARALQEDMGFLESAGAAWYRRAFDSASALVGRGPEGLAVVADRFTDARRILNYLADRYLFRGDLGLARPA